MNKTILGIAIAGAFLIGILSANPVVEAVGGWQQAFVGLDTRITALENQPPVDISGLEAQVTDLETWQDSFTTYLVRKQFTLGPTQLIHSDVATCNVGDVATGGGYGSGGTVLNEFPRAGTGFPETGEIPFEWVHSKEYTIGGQTMTSWVVCIDLPPFRP